MIWDQLDLSLNLPKLHPRKRIVLVVKFRQDFFERVFIIFPEKLEITANFDQFIYFPSPNFEEPQAYLEDYALLTHLEVSRKVFIILLGVNLSVD